MQTYCISWMVAWTSDFGKNIFIIFNWRLRVVSIIVLFVRETTLKPEDKLELVKLLQRGLIHTVRKWSVVKQMQVYLVLP